MAARRKNARELRQTQETSLLEREGKEGRPQCFPWRQRESCWECGGGGLCAWRPESLFPFSGWVSWLPIVKTLSCSSNLLFKNIISFLQEIDVLRLVLFQTLQHISLYRHSVLRKKKTPQSHHLSVFMP